MFDLCDISRLKNFDVKQFILRQKHAFDFIQRKLVNFQINKQTKQLNYYYYFYYYYYQQYYYNYGENIEHRLLEHRTLKHRAWNIQGQNPRTYNIKHQIIEHKNIKNVTLNITIQNIRTFKNVRKYQKILETILIEFDNGKSKYVIVNPVNRSRNGSIKAFQVVFNRTKLLNENIVFVDEFN